MAEDQTIGSLWVKLGIDSSELSSGVGTAALFLNQTIDLFQKFEDAGVDAFENTVGAAMDYAHQIQDLSNITDMSYGDVQRWRQTFIDMGADPDSATQIFKILTQKLGETGDAGDTLRARVTALGVTYQDVNGHMLDTSTIMQRLLPALSDMADVNDRNNLAAALFGRSWSEANGLIEDGTKAVADFKAQSPAITDAEINATLNFRTEFTKLNAQLDITKDKIGIEMIPSLHNLAGELEEGFSNNSPIYSFFSWLDGAIETVVEGLANFVGQVEAATIAVSDIASGKGLAQAQADYNTQLDKTKAYITDLAGQYDLLKNSMAKSNDAQTASPDGVLDSNTTKKEDSLGNAAKNASSTKSSSTIASGWSSKSVVGGAKFGNGADS